MKVLLFVFQILFILLILPTGRKVFAGDLQLSVNKHIAFDDIPLDLATSADGKYVYVLVPGKIMMYSPVGNQIIDVVSVDTGFDKMALTRDNYIVLSGSKSRLVRTYKFEKTAHIDLSGSPTRGAEEAPVVIAVYSDYQCPYCAQLEPLLRQLLEKFPKDIKVAFKNYPLDFHKMGRKAATAALAAHDQKKYWEFHDRLFAHNGQLDDLKIQGIARDLKLDVVKFNKKLQDPEIQRIIDRDIAEGKENGVNGTPNIFINGKLLKDRSLAGFEEMIRAERKINGAL